MKRSRLTPLADADLASIGDYYEERNPTAGRRVLQQLRARCRRLAGSPQTGRLRSDLGVGIRGTPVGRYIIFHRPSDDGTLILRVLHGSRDIGPEDFVELDED